MKKHYYRFLFICITATITLQFASGQIIINKNLPEAYEIQRANTIAEFRDFSELGPYVGTAIVTSIQEDTLNLKEVVFPSKENFIKVQSILTEKERKNQELNSNVMFVFSKLKGDTLYFKMSFFSNPILIEHKVFEGMVQTKYSESMGEFKALKLNMEDKFTQNINVPVNITKFELNNLLIRPDETLYGYCELETDPFYRLIDIEYDGVLRVKRKFKYYFCFKINGL